MKKLLLFLFLSIPAFALATDLAGTDNNSVRLLDEAGNPFGIRQVDNMPTIISTTHGHQVALGNIEGHETINIIGYDSDTGTVLTDISELGTAIIPIPTSAARVEISSTDADDTKSGTGAGMVQIHGLDSNFDKIEENLDMRGLGIVTSVNSYIRFNAFHSYSVGSTGVAEGIISIKNIGGATEYTRIGAGGNKALTSLFTVPNGKIGTVESWTPGFATISNNTIGRALFRATLDYTRDALLPGVFVFQAVAVGQNSSTNIPIQPPLSFPARTDIKISSQKVAGTATMATSSNYNVMIEDE